MNFELFFFTFSCILISYNLSAMVKKLTCFMFSYCINYSRHLTLKQQKTYIKGYLFKWKADQKINLYCFSHLVNVTCFCIYVENTIFYFLFEASWGTTSVFAKKKTFTVALSISFDHLCYSLCHHFTWLFLLRLFKWSTSIAL